MTSTIGDRAADTARADALPALIGSDATAMSWGELFDEYAPALTYYARSRGVREPEDLIQEVFVAAFRQLPRFTGDRSGLRSLLFTIAYRRIADHHRRCYRRPEILVAEHSPRPDPGPTVEQIFDLGETAAEAMQALTVLSERERRVLEMRILEEGSPASVGRALGLSSGNVRVIQARALVKLRNHLRAMGGEGLPMPLFVIGSLSDSIRFLRTDLPADGPVGRWIEEVRANPVPASPETAALGIVGRATDAAHSLVSAMLPSGTAGIGAVVTAVALATAPLLPAVILGTGSSSLSDTTVPMPVSHEETAPASRSVDVLPVPGHQTSADRAPADFPTRVRSNPVETSSSDPAPEYDAPQNSVPDSADLVDDPGMSSPIGEAGIAPLVGDTVEPLVDEVVGVVDQTVGVVEDTPDTVDEAAQPLADETVEPLVDGMTDPLEDLVPGLGGLGDG